MEGKDLKYHTYPELMVELNLIERKYSEIVSMETIGLSLEGRTIPALKISDTPLEKDKDPAILYVSLLHGIEVIGMEVLLGIIKKLTNDYGREEYITNLVRNREIWFVPVVNPDGFVRRRRKNFNEVDLNRNFSVGFSSKGWLNEWRKYFFYPGPYPFSEPETRALKNFIENHNFAIALSFHSFWEVINFPYGYKNQKARDYNLFKAIGEEMGKRQPYRRYGVKQLNWFYSQKGSLEDELYENYNILAFLIEVSKGEVSILKPSTWFNLFSWFNPEDTKYHVANVIDAALYLIEIADNPKNMFSNNLPRVEAIRVRTEGVCYRNSP